MENKFEIGEQVAWEPVIASQHGRGSVMRMDALPPGTPTGTIKEIANDRGTNFVVAFPAEHLEHPAVQEASATHPEPNCLTLTQDEIVKVIDEPTPPRVHSTDDDDPTWDEHQTVKAENDALKAELAALKGGTQ